MHRVMRRKVWAKAKIPVAHIEIEDFKLGLKAAVEAVLDAIRFEIHNEIDKCTRKAIMERLTDCGNGECQVMILATLYKDETEGFLI